MNRTVEVLASGFVGALALAVSTYNVYLQRAQVRPQVWPHLEWSDSNAEEGAFEWRLTNAGVECWVFPGDRAVNPCPMKDLTFQD